MVKPIKEQDFSPLENFMAVYNIVKNFKDYRENENNPEKARKLKYILDNEYIVCSGFTRLLIILCEKVGIKPYEITVDVGRKNKEYKTNERERSIIKLHHSRCLVSIDDDKYDVHGIYMSDPTWDNELGENRFNHALMTFDKMQVSCDMFYYSFFEPILDIHNFKEFNEQINFLLRKIINENCDWSYKNFNRVVKYSYAIVLTKVIFSINCDPMFEYFNNKRESCKEIKDFEDLLTELGNYLLTRIKQKIDDEKLIDAVLYTDDVLGNENDEEELIDKYYTLDFISFPYRVDKRRKHKLIKKRVYSYTAYLR